MEKQKEPKKHKYVTRQEFRKLHKATKYSFTRLRDLFEFNVKSQKYEEDLQYEVSKLVAVGFAGGLSALASSAMFYKDNPYIGGPLMAIWGGTLAYVGYKSSKKIGLLEQRLAELHSEYGLKNEISD